MNNSLIAPVSIALLCLLSSVLTFPAPREEEQTFDKLEFALNNGADVAFTQNGSIISVRQRDVDVIIFGDAGLITSSQANGTQTLNISVINIMELDENNIFTGHNFSLVDALYTVDALFSATVDGANVTAANLTTPLLDGATLVLTVMVLSDDGEFTAGLTPLAATAGSIKLIAEVRDWTFCEGGATIDDTCINNSTGNSVEITFNIIGHNATIGRVGNNSLGFQLTNTVNFTAEWGADVLVDDEFQPLQEGYPVLPSVNENVTQITFGLPRFDANALLDLVIIDNNNNFFLNSIETVVANQTKLDIYPNLLSLSELAEPQASVQISVANIRELNIAGQPVGMDGVGAISQHAQTGLFGSLLEATLPITTFLGSAPCEAVNVSGPLRAFATANITNYLFTNSSSVLVNNATFDIDASTMLMMIDVRNWSFCEANGLGFNQCTGTDIGSYLEVVLEVSSYLQTLILDKDNIYKMGKSITVTLPTQMVVDGFFLNMDPGFPRVDVRDGKSYVVLRFPKFATAAQYGALFRVANK